MEPLAFPDERTGLGFEPRQIVGIGFAFLGQSAASAQLRFRQLARQKGALIEQPGENMHQPCRGAEPFDRQRYPGQILELAELLHGPQIECCACDIRKQERLRIEVFDDFFVDVAPCHDETNKPIGPILPAP